jgi:mycofactocin precursor
MSWLALSRRCTEGEVLMAEPTTATLDTEADANAPAAREPEAPDALVEEDLLVEDVSIDGMCGVY